MLAELFSWWVARMRELLPSASGAAPDGIVLEPGPDGEVTAHLRKSGREQPLPLGAVARLAGRRPVLLRPPPGTVLVKTHTVPTAARSDLDQMLRLELGRITPFEADAVHWQWESHPRPNDRAHQDIRLTIVPRITLAPILDRLDRIGIHPRLLEIAGHPVRILDLQGDAASRSRRQSVVRLLAWTAAALAVAALVLPFALQAWERHKTENAIESLRPSMARAEALRRKLDASSAGRDIVARQRARSGDVPAILAAVTRVLPDDTYLTDLTLRQRQLTIGGRSASAATLITALAADPLFRNVAFAAPVTRIEGSAVDVFSIRAEIAP